MKEAGDLFAEGQRAKLAVAREKVDSRGICRTAFQRTKKSGQKARGRGRV